MLRTDSEIKLLLVKRLPLLLQQVGFRARIRRFCPAWALLWALLLLCGCYKLPSCKVTESFEGICKSLKEGKVVSLVMVHGIGGYSLGDPDGLIQGLERELGLEKSGYECLRRIRGGDPEKIFGWVKREDFLHPDSGTEVRIYTVDWRETTWEDKALIRRLDMDSHTPHVMVPMLYNGRKGFVGNGLTDMALYLGNYGPAIRFPLNQALRWIHEDTREVPEHQLFVVTYSFGCHLTLDAFDELGRLGTEGNDAGAASSVVREDLLRETAGFFMLSSELPLLYYAKIRPSAPPYKFRKGSYCEVCSHCFPASDLEDPDPLPRWNWEDTALGRFMSDKREADPNFQITVINDPNDLLSYRVEDVFIPKDAKHDVFINVQVRNTRWCVCGFADPIKAHEGYGKNRQVIRMIAHGVCRKHAGLSPLICSEDN